MRIENGEEEGVGGHTVYAMVAAEKSGQAMPGRLRYAPRFDWNQTGVSDGYAVR